MRLFKLSISDYFYYILAFLFFGSVYPGLWDRFIIGNTTVLYQLGFLMIWVIMALPMINKFRIKKSFCILLLVSFITCALHCLIHQDNPGGLILYVEAFVIIGLISTKHNQFMKVLLWFNAIMVVLSVVGVILAYMGLLSPIGTPLQMPNDDAYVDNYLFFFVKKLNDVADVLFRSCGYYDEPGSFAYVIMLSLIYNKIHIGSKQLETIFLYGGLATLSAAHIFTVLLYVFFFNLKNHLQRLSVLLIALGVFWFASLETDNTILQWIKIASVDRVEKIITGEDESRNYSGSSKMLQDHLIFGDSEKELSKYNVSRDTISFYISKYGLIGSLLIYIPILFIIRNNIRKGVFSDEMKLIYIFMLNCIQRPDFVYPLYLVMIYYTWYSNTSGGTNKSKELIYGKVSHL